MLVTYFVLYIDMCFCSFVLLAFFSCDNQNLLVTLRSDKANLIKSTRHDQSHILPSRICHHLFF